MDLQAVSDKLEIQEVLARYARGVDSKDWELWRSVFLPSATLDYSSVGIAAGSREQVGAILEQSLKAVPMTQHFISNVEVDLEGDRAKVRAMFYNPMQLPGMAELSYCGGCYVHDMVRTPEGWKSERLVEHNEWFVNRPGEPSKEA
jgi:3-phenylpropionate/cinnamic acid dioxygenase small subunit